jgi:hypothetical protein
MSARALQSLRSAFDDRNTVLGLALGTISLLRRLHCLLRRYGAPQLRGTPRTREEFLLLVLGLISFSRAAMSRRRVAQTAVRSVDHPPAAMSPGTPELLR